MKVEDKRVRVGDLTIRYFEAGGAPTRDTPAGAAPTGAKVLVLLHGGGVDSAALSWGQALPELAAGGGGRRVIAPDWPGFGASDRAHARLDIEFLLSFLGDFLDALGLERVSLAGLSMGGAAALGFALAKPDRVERLILVDSYGIQEKTSLYRLSCWMLKFPGLSSWSNDLMRRNRRMARAALGSILKRPGALTEEILDLALAELGRPDSGEAWYEFQLSEMGQERLRTNYLDRLDSLQPPALFIHGSRDGAVPLECARRAAAAARDARLEILEGCGHWAQRDDPRAFLAAALPFLEA